MSNGGDRPVLVTGGAGYIGAQAAKALFNAGYRPVVFDNLVQGRRSAVQWGPLVEGDILDGAALDSVFARQTFDAVMHFAAHSNVGESVQQPEKYRSNNLDGTRSLLEAMKRHGVGKLVFSSTAAVYGVPVETPIRDDASTAPINPYGQSKLQCEQTIRTAGQEWGLGYAILRYFNAAGSDREARIGEDHQPETHLIPLALAAASGTGPPLTLNGEDYPTPDGTCIRDYVHVDDLADGHLKALRAMDRGPMNLVANLGTGRGYSVREIIAAVEKVTGMPVPVVAGPRRPGDPPVLVSKPSESMAALGWAPRFGKIEAIVTSAWRWHCRQQGLEF